MYVKMFIRVNTFVSLFRKAPVHINPNQVTSIYRVGKKVVVKTCNDYKFTEQCKSKDEAESRLQELTTQISPPKSSSHAKIQQRFDQPSPDPLALAALEDFDQKKELK